MSQNAYNTTGKYIVCQSCGYDKNALGSLICNSCDQSLVSLNQESSEGEPKKPIRNKKSTANRKKTSLLIGGGTATAVGLCLIASTLNANSPEAAIRRAKGRISFGGEPCAQRLINEKIAKEIEKINSGVRFRYTDNNRNKDQIQELIDGEIDIAFSEKTYQKSHFQRAKERGVEITAISYAYDGIAYITDKSTKIRPLTVEELEAIFEGRITNWKQLGSKDQKIVPILMAGLWSNPMGIRLDDGLNPNTIYAKSRAQAKKILKNTAGGIFYTSATLAAHELTEVNLISLKKEDGTVVSPVIGRGITNHAEIENGNYPLVRSLIVMVNSKVFNQDKNSSNQQDKGIRAFVEYLLTEKGQSLVDQNGFVAKHEVSTDQTNRFSFLNIF